MKNTSHILGILALTMAWGQASQPIHLPSYPALSPDGSTILFSWHGDIWSASSKGGQAHRITVHPAQDFSPMFTPDGKSICFGSTRAGSFQVFIKSIDGGNARQITYHTDGSMLQDIAPDGKSILIQGVRDFIGRKPYRLYQVAIDGKSPEKLVFNAYSENGRFSPDGKSIIFTREGTKLYRKGYHGTQASQVWTWNAKGKKAFTQPVSSEYGCRTPFYDTNGKDFYYTKGGPNGFNLWKWNAANNTSTPITHFKDDSVMQPSISRDGSTLIFRHLFDFYTLSTNQENAKPHKLKLWHTEDLKEENEQDRIIQSTTDTTFSPSGLEIAFTAEGDIWAMDTVLKKPHRLTHTPGYEKDLWFSHDGKSIFYLYDDGLKTEIRKLVKTDPSQYWWNAENCKHSVVIEAKERPLSIIPGPKGEKIAYTTYPGNLWTCKIDGTKRKKLVDAWESPRAQWSPDGNWLTYALEDNNFNPDIYIIPADGSSKPVNISSHPDIDFNPVWSPNGRRLAFVGKHYGSQMDIFYVELYKKDDIEDKDAKILEKALSLMKKDPTYKQIKKKASVKKAPAKKAPVKKDPAKKVTPEPKKQQNDLPIDQKTVKPNSVSTIQKVIAANSNQPVKPSKVTPKPPVKKADKPQAKTPEKVAKSKETPKQPSKPTESKTKQKVAKKKVTPFDLKNITQRLHRIQIRTGTPTRLIWSHDSKSILFQMQGKKGLYSVEAKRGGRMTKLSSESGSPIRMSKHGKLYWLSHGQPSVFSNKSNRSYSFKIYGKRDRTAWKRMVFRTAWGTMRDMFYDPAMNNRNWESIRKKYEPEATRAVDSYSMNRIINMMLGELNASHMGFYGNTWPAPWRLRKQWIVSTQHLGVRFDQSHQGKGWKVASVIPQSPADLSISKLNPGDLILEVGGEPVDSNTPITSRLNLRSNEKINLLVQDPKGKKREVKLLPISYGEARSLATKAYLNNTAEKVNKLSDGKLGYIHVARMMWDEFEKFQQHLYQQGVGKEALVIDVRDNGGGFTTDHLLTALCQPNHAFTVPRNGGVGYPQDRTVYTTWNKPIIVLCNQNSFSNAEIFAHAIRNLKRGKLVGVATAGGVISTGSVQVMDAGKMRLPFRGWFSSFDGKDMELNGAQPHVTIWNKPGELSRGKDVQLEKAVQILLEDAKNAKKLPKPQYRSARSH